MIEQDMESFDESSDLTITSKSVKTVLNDIERGKAVVLINQFFMWKLLAYRKITTLKSYSIIDLKELI